MTFKETILSIVCIALAITSAITSRRERKKIDDLDSQIINYNSMLTLDYKILAKHYASVYDSLRTYQTSLTSCNANGLKNN